MGIEAYFNEDIHDAIVRHLDKAESEVLAAVAWFTDRKIFDALCQKASGGVKVVVALLGDDINLKPGGLHFPQLEARGGQVHFLPAGDRNSALMHNKFCIIDGSTVLSGSANWTNKARRNQENLTIFNNEAEIAQKFRQEFDNILALVGASTPAPAIDAEAVRRRLEMIRNLILLQEKDDIPSHLNKLRPAAHALDIGSIIAALDAGEYKTAAEEIENYLHRATALVVAGLADIPRLRLQLELLELQLETLAAEKADLERRLQVFNRRHDDALGDVIQRLLHAQAELARLRMAAKPAGPAREQAEAEAETAEETYQEYSRQHETLQSTPAQQKLSEADEKTLKDLYRKACQQCHPDKFSHSEPQLQAAAQEIFVELTEAYKANDLRRVREIYRILKTGGIPQPRASRLSQADALRASIAETEHRLARIHAELYALQQSDAVQLMHSAGNSEDAWQAFFAEQQQMLEAQYSQLAEQIASLQNPPSNDP